MFLKWAILLKDYYLMLMHLYLSKIVRTFTFSHCTVAPFTKELSYPLPFASSIILD